MKDIKNAQRVGMFWGTTNNEACSLSAITGAPILVHCHVVKFLKLIWKPGTHQWYLWLPFLHMSCSNGRWGYMPYHIWRTCCSSLPSNVNVDGQTLNMYELFSEYTRCCRMESVVMHVVSNWTRIYSSVTWSIQYRIQGIVHLFCSLWVL